LDSVRCNDLTKFGGTTLSTSFASFDGTATGYFTAPSDYYFVGDFSISVWYRPSGAFGAWNPILQFDPNTAGSSDIVHFVYSLASGQAYTTLAAQSGTSYKQTGSNVCLPSTSQQVSTGLWVHLAVTLTTNTVIIYVNGTNYGYNTVSNPSQPGCNFTCNLAFGANNVLRTSNWIGRPHSSGDSWAQGSLKKLRVFNYGLSSSQILTDMNNP
jgi:hypothetical protein